MSLFGATGSVENYFSVRRTPSLPVGRKTKRLEFLDLMYTLKLFSCGLCEI